MAIEDKENVEALNKLIFGEMSGINHTYRFSGQKKIRNQSVAEHSYWTAIIAVSLARYENSMCKKYGVIKSPIIIGKLYDQCMMHDVDEVISGDINHIFKHNEESEAFKVELNKLLEKRVPNVLFDNILCGEYYKKAWKDSHKDDDYNFLLKMGDWLQLYQYAVEEYKLGNTYFLEIIKRVLWLLSQKFSNLERYSLIYAPNLIKNFIDQEWSKYE